MDHLIYTAMNGARQVMERQATNNHNLANLSTTGFRADYDASMALPVYGPGHASRVYTQDSTVGINFSQGATVNTGRDMDVAVGGNGFIAVQGRDGLEGYTRAGDLRVSAEGFLETGAGHPVMGNGGPITLPPYEKLDIASDGTISIIPLGQAETEVAVIDRIKLVNPQQGELEKGEDGLLRLKNGDVAEADADVKLMTGSLESSNVNAVSSLVNMIELSRQFEMHIKILKAAEEADQSSAKVLSMS